MNLNNWNERPEQEISELDSLKVHREIARLRATYPAELARNLFMDSEKIGMIVKKLLKEEKIKQLNLNPDFVDERLGYRIGHFWNKGILGYFMFNRMNWLVQR